MNMKTLQARFAFLLLALTSALPLTAQQPPTMVGFTAAGDANQMVDKLQLRDDSLAQVLSLLETFTGRSVIRPQALPTPTFTFDSHGPITKQQAILALESLLSLNGIAIAPLGDRFIKVVPIGNVRTEAPELVIGSLRDQPPSGRIVSKLFRLEHLDTTSFQQQIQPFLSPGFGAVVPFQNTNTLLVTDTVSNLQRLEYVLGEVDKPRNLVTKFYTLRYAQAATVAEKVKSLIESTRSAFTAGNAARTGSAQPVPGVPVPMPSPGDSNGGATQALLNASTSLNFDERTNQIILVTDPASVSFFDNLIEKLDIQADLSTSIAVIQIYHANATDVASVLSQFISGSTQSTSNNSTADAARRRSQGNMRQTFQTTGDFTDTSPNRQAQVQQPIVAALNASLAQRGNERESQFSNAMTIVADERSNSIVASGNQDDINLVKELIKQIDVVLPQVRIEVLIAEVTLGKTIHRGIDAFDLNIVGDKVVGFGGSGAGFSITNGKINRAVTQGQVSLDAAISTANTNSDVNILSVPSVVTTHNKEASILVGEARPIVTATQSDYTGSTSTSGIGLRTSFTFQDIGLELKVKPLIGSDGTIQMELDQSADDINGFETIDGNRQPIITRRQATSFITAADGQITVLGGLQTNKKSLDGSQFPYLGELPFIGWLFGSHTKENTKKELLMFIRPTLLANPTVAHEDANKVLGDSKQSKEVKDRINGVTH